MMAEGNVDKQMSVNKMEEGDEGVRKVECLRGRLIAERAASKLAKEEAELMEIKLGKLETELRLETESRKKADKRLKFLMKKLQSLNIPYSSDDTDMSSVSSSVSSTLTQSENNKSSKLQIKDKGICKIEQFEEKEKSRMQYEDSEVSASYQSHLGLVGRSLDGVVEANSGGTREFEPCQSCNNAEVQDQSSSSSRDSIEQDTNKAKKTNEAQDDHVDDDSLALVPVDLPKEPPQVPIDPLILDANVNQVLEALHHAKQRLLLSMERRHSNMIGVGHK